MDNMSILDFLASFDNSMTETEGGPDVIRHRCTFIPFLCIEILIIIMDIDILMLSDMNLAKMIPHLFQCLDTCNMLPLPELDSSPHETHCSTIRT